MRILMFSQYFWPENFQINDVVRSLAARCDRVDVLTGKPNYPDGVVVAGHRAWGCQTQTQDGVTIHRVPLLPRGRNSAVRLALNYVSFVLSALLFAPWMLRGRAFDAIFVYAPSPILQALPALFLGRIKHCPVILWVQDLWPQSLVATGYVRSPRVLRWVEKVVRFIYARTDLILVQSRAFEQPVAALAPGKTIAYLPNSVDPMFVTPPVVQLPDIAPLRDGFSILFAGNIGAGQAVETIVEAASLLSGHADIRFVVIGSGSRRDWMLEQARARNLANLHLPGRFAQDTMPGLMRQASALLVTLADEPIFAATVPNKIQAYLAVGRPILACLNGEGARIVVEAGAGLAVPAQDGRALADAVLQLRAMSTEQRMALGENGQRYFGLHFDHDRLVDQLIEHFRDNQRPRRVQ